MDFDVASTGDAGRGRWTFKGWLIFLDTLTYPPRDLQLVINRSKTPIGGTFLRCLYVVCTCGVFVHCRRVLLGAAGVMTCLLPVLLAITFGISWSNNLKLPLVRALLGPQARCKLLNMHRNGKLNAPWANFRHLQVSQTFERDISELSDPPYLAISCRTKDEKGNANPFCKYQG